MTRDYTCDILRQRVAACFDYAMGVLKIPKEEFAKVFFESKLTEELESGSPKYLFGMSGTDFCELVLQDAGIDFTPVPYASYERSAYFWAGDYLSYYRHTRGCSFRYIFSFLSMERLLSMYPVYHETDVTYFSDELDRLRKLHPSNLSAMRKRRELSQSDLSLLSGVPVRTIQAYEQKSKDINRAEVRTALNLCAGLGCDLKEILEL